MFKINSSFMRPNITRTIRFSEEIYSNLKKIAKNEDISFNSLVLQCCYYAINNYEKLNDTAINEKDRK